MCVCSKGMVAVDPGSPDSASTPTRQGTMSIHVHVGHSGLSSALDTSIKDSMDSQMSAATEEGYQSAVNRKIKNLQVYRCKVFDA